ncbi:MAG: cell envelope integrity protein CreD [Burkholderiaceae bacterium]
MQSRAMWWKVIILAGVTVLLLVALMRIGWLVDERQGRQRDAERSVAEAMAGEQVLLGPLLQRRCTEEWQQVSGTGADRKVTPERRQFVLSSLPAQLTVDGSLTAASRYRGLFKVNGYNGQLTLQAQWPSLAALTPKAEMNGRLSCDAPTVMLSVSDARGLRSVTVKQGSDALTVQPGTQHDDYPRGLHAVLIDQPPDQPLHLSMAMQLVGMKDFGVVPAASATVVHLRSNWPHPSFGGRFLPATREVTEQGFDARWEVSELATNAVREVQGGKRIPIGRAAAEAADGETTLAAPAEQGAAVDTLNVAMLDPINPYVMSDRAIKYGLMFIILTFVCVGLLELLANRRVHPVQYLLVGLAMTLFFLLLLSLSEHLSFAISYLLAAGSAVGLLTFYGSAMLGSLLRGLGFGAVIAALYGALYVLLNLEQASLLIGSMLLFAVLAAVMTLTRRVDWYAFNGRVLTPSIDTR